MEDEEEGEEEEEEEKTGSLDKDEERVGSAEILRSRTRGNLRRSSTASLIVKRRA